jgi:hypothetical protein
VAKRKRDKRRREVERRKRRREPLIGYVARQGINVVCDGDACIVAGSQAAMVSILQHHGRDPKHYLIEKAMASQILQVLELGGAYAFDEEAYGRFLEPAHSAGLPLGKEDFSDPGPTGIHLVRVGYL